MKQLHHFRRMRLRHSHVRSGSGGSLGGYEYESMSSDFYAPSSGAGLVRRSHSCAVLRGGSASFGAPRSTGVDFLYQDAPWSSENYR